MTYYNDITLYKAKIKIKQTVKCPKRCQCWNEKFKMKSKIWLIGRWNYIWHSIQRKLHKYDSILAETLKMGQIFICTNGKWHSSSKETMVKAVVTEYKNRTLLSLAKDQRGF